MMNDTTRTGLVIESTDRRTDSRAGNPRYRVHFRDGTTANTMSDAPIAEGAWLHLIGQPVTVTFTAAHKIRSIEAETAAKPEWKFACACGFKALNRGEMMGHTDERGRCTAVPEGYYPDHGELRKQHDVYGGPHDEPPVPRTAAECCAVVHAASRS